MSVILLTQWLIILCASLYVVIKGAHLLLVGVGQLGRSLGFGPYIIRVGIMGMSTALPALAISIAGALAGETTIVIATVVGSNIANILLIVGLLALFGGRMVMRQELATTELPIFCIATALFVMVILDGTVDRLESVLLLATLGTYLGHIFAVSKKEQASMIAKAERENFSFISIALILFGVVALVIGSKFAVAMTVNIATGLSLPIGLIAITALAIGTTLPGLFVTQQAIGAHQSDIALGNVFGAIILNLLVVTAVPGLFAGNLVVDAVVLELGLSTMVVASIILFVLGLSRQLLRWEGLLMLTFFTFFMLKLAIFI